MFILPFLWSDLEGGLVLSAGKSNRQLFINRGKRDL